MKLAERSHLIVVALVRFLHRCYKVSISPLFGNACRFEPYCSDYAVEAIEKHGLLKGSLLAIKRLSKCHPYNKGGHDPVPPRLDKRTELK